MSKQIIQRSIQHRYVKNAKTSSLIAASTLSGMAAMYFINNSNGKTQTESLATRNTNKITTGAINQENIHFGIIETDFTDKIASKSYLNYHNTFVRDSLLTSARNTSKKIWNKVARSNRSPTSVSDYYDNDSLMTGSGRNSGGIGSYKQLLGRPKGVPRRIRVLAIDVPEFREVFDGECRVNLSRIYPDDIAPPKIVAKKEQVASKVDNKNDDQNDANSTKNTKTKNKKTSKKDVDNMEIIQKSLARSLVRCRNVQSKRIGVELLETSVYDLNPHNMRRTYQFGSYRYDPGKYGSMKKTPGDDMLQRRITAYGGIPRGNPRDMVVTKNRNQDKIDGEEAINGGDNERKDEKKKEQTVLASDEDEVDAPWNQYAWIEEMELRIHGRIPFGSNVERTSWLTRKLYGANYRTTVKNEKSSIFLWFLPTFLVGSKAGGYDGVDGDYGKNRRTINRASSKPHAVIADGSAMQRVPGSLRYLTKCCQEADVPLFIINDPRVWGGNTHQDLESAAKDMRKTMKARIVANALTIKEGSMFQRGRILGKLESETKWQLKDAGRRTREAVQTAAARLQKEREENWSELNGEELLQRLLDRKVIQMEGGKFINDHGVGEAFGELCRQYLNNSSSDRRSDANAVTNVTDNVVEENVPGDVRNGSKQKSGLSSEADPQSSESYLGSEENKPIK